MKLTIDDRRLLPGTHFQNGALILPAAGGGVNLPELAGCGPRWLNFTITVLSDHAQAFELRVFGESV